MRRIPCSTRTLPKSRRKALAGLLALAFLALTPSYAGAAVGDPMVIGELNRACSGSPECFTSSGGNPTTTLRASIAFPRSALLVRNVPDGGPFATGFAITGESDDGTGLFGLGHSNAAAVVAENSSTGAALFAKGRFGDGVFSTTQAINRSGVYGENTSGVGWGVVGRSNADQRPAVWGDNLAAGDGVFGSSATGNSIHGSQDNGVPAVHGQNFGTGAGGLMFSKFGDGLVGVSDDVSDSGVYAVNRGGGYGLVGRTGGDNRPAVWGDNTGGGNGVFGRSVGALTSGVYGENTGGGYGVAGRSNLPAGVGVLADSTGGTALQVAGKAQFSRSGRATVAGTGASPKNSVQVQNVALSANSLVLVTPQKNVPGVWLQAAVPQPANNRIILWLNQNVTVNYPLAWMVIERP
jgi:hypothetical protein